MVIFFLPFLSVQQILWGSLPLYFAIIEVEVCLSMNDRKAEETLSQGDDEEVISQEEIERLADVGSRSVFNTPLIDLAISLDATGKPMNEDELVALAKAGAIAESTSARKAAS
jgi:hypothetical protein